MKHIPYKCKQPCDVQEVGRHCAYCDGGLFFCVVCKSAEGELTTDCRGSKLSKEARDAVYNGIIDFKDGAWIVSLKTE